jgi:hypothetical protein
VALAARGGDQMSETAVYELLGIAGISIGVLAYMPKWSTSRASIARRESVPARGRCG